jgi:hypothetical protein
MFYTNISHKKIFEGAICDFSTELDSEHSVKNITKEKGFWSTKKSNSIEQDFFIIDYKEEVPANFIQISASPSGKTTFPSDFRIELSIDGSSWKNIQAEKSFNLADLNDYTLYIPLTVLRFIKMVIIKPGKVGTKFFSEIGRFQAGIAGIKEITSSSSSSYKNDPTRLCDGNNDTYWESNITQKKGKENLNIDLGNIFQINRISFSSTDLPDHAFPENFIISISKDNDLWTSLLDERGFAAESLKKYYWDINPIEGRFIHINMDNVKLDKNSYAIRLSEIRIFGAVNDFTHTHNIGELVSNASVFQYGIVKLAKNGEETESAVVQSTDSRLKDATNLNKGIVLLADDGDDKPCTAVQASDSRLKKADELKYGIVRLAKDREDNPDVVVKGNDSRLKKATETNFGIVKICTDGEYSEFGVVLGNDSRIHKATKDSFGIVRIADNGEVNPNCVVQGNDKRLRDATINYKGIVELAENGEDKEGVAVQGNDKRLKDATIILKGIVELAENGEDKENVAVQGNDKRLKDATTISKGIVELAENGEDKEGVAVQGNDSRLRTATINSYGIVKLAENGEDKEGVAVQGNDKRLKDATTISKGIVELAENGEDKENVAVQGNDKRLKDATTISKGIVELAENGEDKENVAVQGNDKRLKDATIISKGIVELAENGEDKEGVAVQGNDKRLKDATTISKGIVELAENGEDKENVAVQGNDKRLKDATTISKGIVELAENGEDKENVAVQGNDSRLKTATINSYGIVKLAKNNEKIKNAVVQADDERLSDSRKPLQHDHDYADIKHEFSSHTGTIKIIDKKEENISSIVPPSERSAIIYAKNESEHPGAVGIAGVVGHPNNSNPKSETSIHSYGILGHGRFAGVRGQSTGNTEGDIKGAGVLGISRFGAGGVFASEHNYSLVADGYGTVPEYDGTINLKGNGDALFVNGNSLFNGMLAITNDIKKNDSPANIVEMFEVDEEQIIIAGDILVASGKGKAILTRSTSNYSRGVIGIVSGNPSVIINNSSQEKKIYPIVLAGKTLCRIDARKKPVKPGDLIVTSDSPGCGMSGEINSFERIGTVIGKALDGLETGIGIIPVFVTHQ